MTKQSVTFKAYDATIVYHSYTVTDAMLKANKAMLWTNPNFKDGAWFETESNTFEWREGNYFD